MLRRVGTGLGVRLAGLGISDPGERPRPVRRHLRPVRVQGDHVLAVAGAAAGPGDERRAGRADKHQADGRDGEPQRAETCRE